MQTFGSMETQTVIAEIRALCQRTVGHPAHVRCVSDKQIAEENQETSSACDSSHDCFSSNCWPLARLVHPDKRCFDSYGTVPQQPELFMCLRTIRCNKKLLIAEKRYQRDESDV
jgi:hypothetical protein